MTRCFPVSMLVFQRLGIDTGCGATATLETAAAKAGITTDALMAQLEPCTEDDPPRRDNVVTRASE